MGFTLKNITWAGPDVTDTTILAQVPDDLRWLLGGVNGFIQFDGGFHVRGACSEPQWHSLRAHWKGPSAIHRMLPGVRDDDVPFAQDYLGNQFLLRKGLVIRVSGETGKPQPALRGLVAVGDSGVSEDPPLPLQAFLMLLQEKPESLGMELLDEFLQAGGKLKEGELLDAYPPFCSREAANGASIRVGPVPVATRLAFLGKVAARASAVPDGKPSFPRTR